MRIRVEAKPAFAIVGEKTWIPGQDSEPFGRFWAEAHRNGLVKRLKALAAGATSGVTGGAMLGVSRVERDPACRAFFFWIAVESEPAEGLPCDTIPACTWAIFSNRGPMPMALVEAEKFAFVEWLPSSGYVHALAPELEVYPARADGEVEFWLPVTRKDAMGENG